MRESVTCLGYTVQCTSLWMSTGIVAVSGVLLKTAMRHWRLSRQQALIDERRRKRETDIAALKQKLQGNKVT